VRGCRWSLAWLRFAKTNTDILPNTNLRNVELTPFLHRDLLGRSAAH
jgi:hypothetical protein